MEGKICPTSNGILWRVLPSLQAIAMAEIVCRLPVIEGLITILYRRIDRSEYVGTEEDVKSTNWLYSERSRRSVGTDLVWVPCFRRLDALLLLWSRS